jgi:hypothetical protein
MAGKKSEPVFVIVYGAQESIPPANVAWRAVMTVPYRLLNRIKALKFFLTKP